MSTDHAFSCLVESAKIFYAPLSLLFICLYCKIELMQGRVVLLYLSRSPLSSSPGSLSPEPPVPGRVSCECCDVLVLTLSPSRSEDALVLPPCPSSSCAMCSALCVMILKAFACSAKSLPAGDLGLSVVKIMTRLPELAACREYPHI